MEATAGGGAGDLRTLFAEHGRPLVMKTDNGGPFRDDETKRLLAENEVIPLFSPKRRPQYNGGVERANGSWPAIRKPWPSSAVDGPGRPAKMPRRPGDWPTNWPGPRAGEARPPASCGPNASRSRPPRSESAFQATVAAHRAEVRAEWHFAADEPLTHDQAAAIDRRAVRDALVEHGLLRIHPRRRTRAAANSKFLETAPGAGTALASASSSADGRRSADSRSHVAAGVHPTYEEANYSTNKSSASGQN